MRYFWSLIVALMMVTVGLNTARRASERNPSVTSKDSAALISAPSFGRPDRATPTEPETRVAADLTPDASTTELVVEGSVGAELTSEIADVGDMVKLPVDEFETMDSESVVVEAPVVEVPVVDPTIVEAVVDEVIAKESSGSGLSLDSLLGVIEEAQESLPDDAVVVAAVDSQRASQEAVVDPMLEAALASVNDEAAGGPVGPAFTVRGDGAVEVEGAGVIVGDGSPQRPFVIDWQVLRSVARDYNPKQGQEQLPDWVVQLDGKTVRVEGNTLLPVVAAAVDELLVMQNPWDGCCIGIPPTPYDAIEVKLSELTRMGNVATGFGMVEGTFKVDPYIVQGWLLGLYVIEDASFESAAGMELPGL
ncbi:MAG: hypothetical protein AB8F26_05380 [Phycisphaerales bacterium]